MHHQLHLSFAVNYSCQKVMMWGVHILANDCSASGDGMLWPDLWPMILTFKLYLDSVKMNQFSRYLDQNLSSVHTWRHTHIPDRLLYLDHYHPPPHKRFMALLPGPPGWAGAKREFLDFMVQGKINRGRHTDHPDGRHSIQTNQCPPPPSPHIFYGPNALSAAKQQCQSTEGK